MIRSLTQTRLRSKNLIDIDEVKAHLRVTGTDDDDYIGALIKAAQEKVEADTRRAFLQAEYELVIETLDNVFDLPKSPVISLDGISVRDNLGQWVEQEEYHFTPGEPATVWLPRSYSSSARIIKIEYTAGLQGEGASPNIVVQNIPEVIKQAMKLLISHWYDNRSATSVLDMKYLPIGYDALIAPHKIYGV